VCKWGDKEIGRFLGDPVLRSDIDPGIDFLFDQHVGRVKCRANAHWRADREVWKISMTGDSGGDSIEGGTSVNQCRGSSLSNFGRDVNTGDGLVQGRFLIRFNYVGLLYKLDLNNRSGSLYLGLVKTFC